MSRGVTFAIGAGLIYAAWKAYMNRNMPIVEGSSRPVELAKYALTPGIDLAIALGAGYVASKVV